MPRSTPSSVGSSSIVSRNVRACWRVWLARYAVVGNATSRTCASAPFAPSDLPDVRHTIFGVTLTSIADYVRDLHEAGFTGITATALSDDWATFCGARMAAWRADRPRHVRVHGEPIYTQLDTFYTVVLRLFRSGSLGGVRLVARVG